MTCLKCGGTLAVTKSTLHAKGPNLVCTTCGDIPQYGYNLDRPVMYVNHRHLKRASEESMFRSECAKCTSGILLVRRDQDTLELSPHDNCIVCGQRYYYMDLGRIWPACR